MRQILFIFLLFLGACGFSPLYQTATSESDNVPVDIAPIADQYGFIMVQTLQNKFGSSSQPRYLLSLSAPQFTQWDQTIDEKNFTTIMGISGSISYQLTEIKTNKVLLSDSTSLLSSYSVVKDPYATVVAEKKVKQELAQQLADQAGLHVLATLAGVRN